MTHTESSTPITITEPALLIIINQLYKSNISPQRLYEVTRGNWSLGERRNKAKYAFAVYRGIVQEVYEINRWLAVQARSPEQERQSRWSFEGQIVQELQHYVGGSVKAYLTPGARTPVRYLNC